MATSTGADHAAGAGAVLDHEGLAETLLQDAADLARRDVGGAAGAEGNDDLDRPRRIILRGALRRNKGRSRKQRHRQRERNSLAPHINLPGSLSVSINSNLLGRNGNGNESSPDTDRVQG